MLPKTDFILLAKDILQDTQMDCYMESTLTGCAKQELQAQLYWSDNDQYMEFTYTPELAPCREVLAHGSFVQLEQVQVAFPGDRGLELVHAQSYIGILKIIFDRI